MKNNDEKMWEAIVMDGDIANKKLTMRLKIEGGWLYIVKTSHYPQDVQWSNLVFVPESK